MSLFGWVWIRVVKPEPTPVVQVEMVCAVNNSSFAAVVVTGPALLVEPVPVAPAA